MDLDYEGRENVVHESYRMHVFSLYVIKVPWSSYYEGNSL